MRYVQKSLIPPYIALQKYTGGRFVTFYGTELANVTGYQAKFRNAQSKVVFESNQPKTLFNSGTYSTNLQLGLNLVGNPYPSGINWNATGWTKLNVDPVIYYRRDNNRIVSYNSQTNVSVCGGTSHIPANQGFMVNCNSSTGGKIGFSNIIREHTHTPIFKNQTQNLVRLKVSNDETVADETVIMFSEQSTENFDNELDAFKIFDEDETLPQLYTQTQEIPASINALPQTSVMNLYFQTEKSGNYTISLTENRMSFASIYLEDAETGTVTDLLKANYTFAANSSDNSNRFKVHFGKITSVQNSAETKSLNIYSYQNEIFVNEIEKNATIEIFDLLGKQIITQKANNSFMKFAILHSGTYIVKVIDANGTTTKKVLIP